VCFVSVFYFLLYCSFVFVFLKIVLQTRFCLLARGMTGKVAQCSSCGMFKVWDDDVSVPADYTCRKCTHLRLLQVRLTELELDELRIIREAEKVIDRSFREITTQKIIDRWVTKRGIGKKQSVQGSPVVVPLSNKYTPLDACEGDDLPGVSGGGVQVSGTESVPVAQKGRGEEEQSISNWGLDS